MRDISLHLLDIVQNSITAKAGTIIMTVAADPEGHFLVLSVEDDGCGMSEELLKKVTDPFTTTRTTRRTGMGIPLLKASAERAGGKLYIRSEVGRGTLLEAGFEIENIDRLPLGDLGDTLSNLILCSPDTNFKLALKSTKGSFLFSTADVKEKLMNVAITEFSVINWIREYVNEAVSSIFGGVLNEVDS